MRRYVQHIRASWPNLRVPVLLTLIVVGGAFLRVYRLADQPLWLDEIFSIMVTTESDLSAIIDWTARNVHPVLYYICLFPFLQIWGTGPLGARIFSALSGILTLVAIPFVGRDLGLGKKAVLFATLLLAISPLHLNFSQEARMYSLLALEALLAIAAFYLSLSLDRFRDWLFYVLITIASLYTHVYAFLLLPAQALYLIWCWVRKPGLPSRTIKHYLVAQATLLILLVPLFLVFPIWWNSPYGGGAAIASPYDFLLAWEIFGAGMTALSTPGLPLLVHPPFQVAGPLLLGGLCLLALFSKLRSDRPSPTLLLGLVVGVPLLEIVTLSWGAQKAFWSQRSLTILAPLVCLLAGAGAARLNSRRLRIALALFFLAISFFNLHAHYFVREKSLAPVALGQLHESAQSGDLLVIDPSWNTIVFDYYYPGSIDHVGYYYADADYFFDSTGQLVEGSVALQGYSRIWLWGPRKHVRFLCRYNAQAEFWYFGEKARQWLQFGPCPGGL